MNNSLADTSPLSHLIICDNHKFIFFRTRKTASSSIRSSLLPHVVHGIHIHDRSRRPNLKTVIADGSSRDENTRLHQHLRPGKCKRLVGADLFHDYFKFVFVRNPWDTMVSRYFWNRSRKRRRANPESMEFPAWLRWYLAHPGSEQDNQWRYVSIDNVRVVDYIGRYETLEQDLRTVFHRVGIDELPVLGHEKGGFRPKAHYREFYDDESRALVSRRYRHAIRVFGYTF